MHKNVRVRQKGYNSKYNTWHTLNRNMILFVHEGDGSIISKERTYPIASGILCFVGSDKFYYTLPDHPENYMRSKMFLSDEELSTILSLFPETMREKFTQDTVLYAKTDEKTALRIAELFDELYLCDGTEEYYNALFTSGVIRLLAEMIRNVADSVCPASGAVQKTAEFINSHIGCELTVDKISCAVHISKYHLCRKFRQATGLTLMQYVLKTRLITAKNLLENETLTIGEIMDICGFSSQSYFGRVFKEAFGVTPLSYRKSL